jgi:hypothetical protein
MRWTRNAICALTFFIPAQALASFSVGEREGRIRGEVHYPACFAPGDLVVCAEATTGEVHCTSPKLEDRITYELTVPRGLWYVFAATASMIPHRRAYYTRAVECGMQAECIDHRPILIQVESGKTTEEVNPDDWYALDPANPRARLAS